MNRFFSIIIPLYNRPKEIKELCESLLLQTYCHFEIIIVEDGSTISSKKVINFFHNKIPIKYFEKDNTGPGDTRNYGVKKAIGDYFIFLDSDCIIPSNYLETINSYLNNIVLDHFGGPEKLDSNSSLIQQAINYSMTSFLTTGGIRGGEKRIEKFHPRSFNMGISKNAFKKVNGFSNMRFGEDIDLSIRIYKENYNVGLIQEAYVYHKRRTSFKQFFNQVFNFGKARIVLSKKHPKSLKFVHLIPTGFIITLLMITVIPSFMIIHYIFYISLFCVSLFKTKNIKLTLLIIIASSIQILGYGLGFLINGIFYLTNSKKLNHYNS